MGVRNVIEAAWRGTVAASAVYAVLLSLAWVSLGFDPKVAKEHVSQSFVTGQLTQYDIMFANPQVGAHQFNDCLIIDQALARNGSRWQMAVTPANDFANRFDSGCIQLKASVDGRLGPSGFYQNYIHGHTVIARVLLNYLPLASIRDLYQTVIYLLVVTGLALALRDIWTHGATPPALFWLCFFAVFLRFFGLTSLGQSLGHGPADAVLFGYAVWLEVQSFRRRSPSLWVVGLFGALTMAFEFLTGGLPLGIVLTVAGIGVCSPSRRSVWLATVCFVAACGAMVIIKIILMIALFGWASVAEPSASLASRMSNSVTPGQRVAPDFAGVLNSVMAGFGEMAGTRPVLAVMCFVMSIAVGVAGWQRLRVGPLRPLATVIASSNLVLVGWVLLFHQHFYIHAWFMTRIFAWTMATGLALFAISTLSRAKA